MATFAIDTEAGESPILLGDASKEDVEAANELAAGLPQNYHFEIPKTIARIKEKKAKVVALQFPEGLLMFAVAIADILEAHTGAKMIILGDVTYGACCVDDLAAASLGADFLVHYGHSCLVSIKDCVLKNMMYVFVEIDIDVQHLVDTVLKFIPKDSKLLACATIQFVSSMRAAVAMIQPQFTHKISVPQQKPLSGGELLGCTSPVVSADDYDCILYVGDGRFHLESFMIQNPKIPAFQYDPYKKSLSREKYDIDEMLQVRGSAIQTAKDAKSVGLIMGTLGRQGNSKLVDHLRSVIEDDGRRKVTVFLMSEIFPHKLAKISDVDCFVQVACPRLSIDWGYAFDRPLLSPFECEMAFGKGMGAIKNHTRGSNPEACGCGGSNSTNEEKGGEGDKRQKVEWDGKYYPMEHYAQKPSGDWGVYATDRG